MRNILLIMLLVSAGWLMAQNLPTCYYTYDQIQTMLSQYETQYPNICKVYTIGHSQEENIPIKAIRISDNAQVEEDEPSILFIGQVHAEEVLGVQITMANILEILSNSQVSPYSQWIQQLDMWFVPTFTPEGHNVVTSNMDTSYRKNKRDNNLNGIFDFSPLVGYDVDGVDINRNMSFNWAHGDTLLQPGSLEVFDYYRGPAPMSESESQALEQLSNEQKFVYSIVWHSSRTGNLSEKLYYPFNWKDVRPSPDLAFFASIGTGIASQINTEAGGGTYQASPNLSRKGATHDWMYQQWGTVQMLIECGTRNIQPDSLLMVDTINRCSNGVRWLLNRSLMFSPSSPSNSMLTGKITDPDGNPLEAQIIIVERDAPWFRKRLSNEDTGRYWKPLTTGTYTLKVRKEGYADYTASVMVNNNAWTTRNVTLQPIPSAAFAGEIKSGGQPIPAKIIFYDQDADTIISNGTFHHFSFEGTYRVEVFADGYFPYIGDITLHPGYNYYVINLEQATALVNEDWEDGMDDWTITGPWSLQSELSASGSAITDSWEGFGFYEQNCDVNITYNEPIYIPGGPDVMLSFDSHLYTEWDYDPCTVEVSTDNGENWTPIWTKSGLWNSFRREFVPMGAFAGQSIRLRFRLVDQSIHVDLTDPGWTLDNIRILTGGSNAVANHDITAPVVQTGLMPNYPNPFNPSTTISYSLAQAQPVKLGIYNLRGQLVRALVDDTRDSGSHSVVWNGTDDNGRPVASGVYLYRLETANQTLTRRMVMIK